MYKQILYTIKLDTTQILPVVLYDVKRRTNVKLRVFENTVLRKLFGTKREENREDRIIVCIKRPA